MQVPVRLRPALVGLLGIVPALMGPAFASERVRGEVVLSAPQCAVFVVRTGQGNSVLEAAILWRSGGASEVRGLLHERSQEIELVGEASVPVKIEDWGLPEQAGRAARSTAAATLRLMPGTKP